MISHFPLLLSIPSATLCFRPLSFLSSIVKCFQLSSSLMFSLPYSIETNSVTICIWSYHFLLRDRQWLSSAFRRELPSMVSRSLYDQAPVCLSTSSLSTLCLPTYSLVILGKLLVTKSTVANHKAWAGTLSFLSLNFTVSISLPFTFLVSAQESFLKALISHPLAVLLYNHMYITALAPTIHTAISYLFVFHIRV